VGFSGKKIEIEALTDGGKLVIMWISKIISRGSRTDFFGRRDEVKMGDVVMMKIEVGMGAKRGNGGGVALNRLPRLEFGNNQVTQAIPPASLLATSDG
jgi:hypothetical protein